MDDAKKVLKLSCPRRCREQGATKIEEAKRDSVYVDRNGLHAVSVNFVTLV